MRHSGHLVLLAGLGLLAATGGVLASGALVVERGSLPPFDPNDDSRLNDARLLELALSRQMKRAREIAAAKGARGSVRPVAAPVAVGGDDFLQRFVAPEPITADPLTAPAPAFSAETPAAASAAGLPQADPMPEPAIASAVADAPAGRKTGAGEPEGQDLPEQFAVPVPVPIPVRPAAAPVSAPPQAESKPAEDVATNVTPDPDAAIEAIEPSAGPTFRRDPLDVPLLESERWLEWLLAAVVNGEELSEGALFIEDPETGRLALELASAEQWRLVIDEDRILTFQGLPFYPLDAIEDATFEIDRASLAIDITVPPTAFESFIVDVQEEPDAPPAISTGAFIDYDVVWQGGDSIRERLDGLVEGGLFGRHGVLVGNVRIDDVTDGFEITRLDTTFSRDFPDRRQTVRFGDTLTAGGAFAQGVRFAGIQLATNFATDPSFVTFPLPTIGGLAEQRSVVDVLIDNLERATETVPGGPFAIRNLPVVTGAGEVQLKVTDLLGRERLVTQTYYVSSRLLREGLHDYSYGAGFQRRDFSVDSFDYGEPLLAGTHKYGLTDAITLEGHAELEPDRGSAVLGGAFLAGNYGLFSAGIGGSADDDAGGGMLLDAAYEYNTRRFDVGLRSRYTTQGFRQAGVEDDAVERVDQVSLGFGFGDFGRLGLLYLNQARRDGEDSRSLTASYSMPLGWGALVLNAARTIEPDTEFALTATWSLPLGPRRSMAARVETNAGDQRARIQYQRNRGASALGLDYRVAAEAGEDARALDARVSYQGSLAAADLDLERIDDQNRLRLGASGSIAAIDGEVMLSRRIGRAFGLVNLPGFPDVRVYLENREAGRTDEHGRLLLPGLRPFEPNRVRLALDDLPLDASLETAESLAVPFDRAGVAVPFAIARTQHATVRLLDPMGEPLPAGLRLSDEDGAVTAIIARDGFAQIESTAAGPVAIEGTLGRTSFRCMLGAIPEDDLMPDMGEITCDT